MKTVRDQDTPKLPVFLAWLFPYKRRHLPIPTESPLAYYLFQNKVSITFFNWLIQGMRGMDRADLIGKIMFDVILISIILLVLDGNRTYDIILAIIVAHTLNWMINTHFWDFGRFLGITHTSPDRFFPYIRKIAERVNKNDSVPVIIVIGSISRNQRFTITSDVDMIFIRGEGCYNAAVAVLVSTWERIMAFFCKFPLHLELYDSIESMKRHREDEVPIVLKDIGNVTQYWYQSAGRTVVDLDSVEKG